MCITINIKSEENGINPITIHNKDIRCISSTECRIQICNELVQQLRNATP
jgi:hypothetical protein